MPGIPTAAGWDAFCVGVEYASGRYPSQRDGTGFLPTDGAFFIDLPARSGAGPSTAGVRQDDVDLSGTTALLFDYQAIGTVADSTDDTYGSATVELLFTGMGTTTLWSKTYPVGDVNEQVLDERAMIDMPPTAGRLTIQVTVVPGGAPGNCCQTTELDFQLDNLRVE